MVSEYINRNVKIKCFNKVDIGENVAISESVTLWDSSVHEFLHENYLKNEPISIVNHVWIGTNSGILKGVTMDDGTVIVTGSEVYKSILQNSLAVGVPAKVIKCGVA